MHHMRACTCAYAAAAAGFAVFQCPLKPDSEPALAALAASSHRLVMITGDAPLTAVYAASKVRCRYSAAQACGPSRIRSDMI